MKKILIYAVNIHVGGGAVLLTSFLGACRGKCECTVMVDSRFDMGKLKMDGSIRVVAVNPTLINRFFSQFALAKMARSYDMVVCFGNLPPIFRLNTYTAVYLQNRYLIDNIKLSKFKYFTRFKIFIEKIWIKFFASNADLFFVQTVTMRDLLQKCIPLGKYEIQILPFFSSDPWRIEERVRELNEKKEVLFFYDASGEWHKNHENLLKAWILLAQSFVFPKLILTISSEEYPDICREIAKKSDKFNLKITFLKSKNKSDICCLYANAAALIYPSFFESLGLPLVEAREIGLPVIASECDYVRDILDPIESFDPHSARSIALAVKRFLKVVDEKERILSSDDFVENILGFLK